MLWYKLNLMCISCRKNLGPHILFIHNFSTILTSSKKEKKKEFHINHNLTVLYQNRLNTHKKINKKNRLNSGHTVKGLITTFQNIVRYWQIYFMYIRRFKFQNQNPSQKKKVSISSNQKKNWSKKKKNSKPKCIY